MPYQENQRYRCLSWIRDEPTTCEHIENVTVRYSSPGSNYTVTDSRVAAIPMASQCVTSTTRASSDQEEMSKVQHIEDITKREVREYWIPIGRSPAAGHAANDSARPSSSVDEAVRRAQSAKEGISTTTSTSTTTTTNNNCV